MDRAIARMQRRIFRKGKPITVEPVAGGAFGSKGFIDRDMQSLTPEGEVSGNETHVQLLREWCPNVGQGAHVTEVETGQRYRLQRRLNDDGYVVRFLVVKV